MTTFREHRSEIRQRQRAEQIQIQQEQRRRNEEAGQDAGTGVKAYAGPVANKSRTPAQQNKATVDATDAARELAEAEGVDLRIVTGTGAGGRITKGDVERVVG